MPLTPLDIPAGVYRHGTDLEGANRWRDVNLVRWRNGSIQPIGGWVFREKTGDSITEAPRGAIAWVDNSFNSNIAVGTASNLYYISSGNAVTDITPAGFTAGNENAQVNVGYGGNFYGTSLYGVSRPYSGVFQECTTWSLDTWGEYLVGCSVDDGKLYEWQLSTDLGTETVTNGVFSSGGAGWTIGTGWTAISNVADAVGPLTYELSQTITVTDSTAYILTFVADSSVTPHDDGDPSYLRVRVVGSSGDIVSQRVVYGTNSIRWNSDDTSADIIFEPFAGTGTAAYRDKIDNVSNKSAPAALQISNAPINCSGLVVTEERFLFALAAGGNPRKVQWSDKEDNTTWTPLATNEAGDIELQTNGEILSGHRMRGRTLILTTTDAHVATYIGPQLVFSFERVGTSCGAISRKACIANQEGAFWMGQKGFFMFNGSSVEEMRCDVLDYVFEDINRSQQSKVWAVHNSQYGEAWWFYPSSFSNINNRYVVFNYKEGYWNIGNIERSAGFDAGVFSNPIWFGNDGAMYDHEKNYDYGDYIPYAETGPLLLGPQIIKVNEIIPDEKTQGDVNLEFKTRFYPNVETTTTLADHIERSYGPYDPSNPTSVRFSGRQIRMRISSSVDVISTGLFANKIYRAATGQEPELSLLSETVNGRKLGDIKNNGSIDASDWYTYLQWSFGADIDDDSKNWIENVLYPYIINNSTAYADFISRKATNWRFGLPRLNIIQGGRR